VSGATCNPQETAVTPHAGSLAPDLVSVAIVPNANGGTEDSIVFTFDDPVTTPGGAAAFGYYTSSGTEVTGAASTIPAPGNLTQNASDSAQWSLNFAAGTTVGAVGGFVANGAVMDANAPGFLGVADALGAANSATTSVAPGAENAPQLQSAVVLSASNQFGVAADSVLLTWDMNISNPPANGSVAPPPQNDIHAYDADGTEMTCEGIGGAEAALDGSQGVIAALTANETVCSAFVLGAAFPAPPGIGTVAPASGQLAAITLVTVDANFATGASGTAGVGVPNPEGDVAVAAA
jgi:hypothetical protein